MQSRGRTKAPSFCLETKNGVLEARKYWGLQSGQTSWKVTPWDCFISSWAHLLGEHVDLILITFNSMTMPKNFLRTEPQEKLLWRPYTDHQGGTQLGQIQIPIHKGFENRTEIGTTSLQRWIGNCIPNLTRLIAKILTSVIGFYNSQNVEYAIPKP